MKVFGAENHNLLSFPIEGYTLALDFKVDALVFKLIRELDAIVLDYGGRIYLAKDALMSESTFKTSYLSWQKFEDIRMKYDAIGHFSSHQSIRLGLQ